MIIAIVKEIKKSDLFSKILQLNHELFVPSAVYDELLDHDSKNECDKLISANKLKVCRLNTKKEIEQLFGFRNIDGIIRPQSWCRDCRKIKNLA